MSARLVERVRSVCPPLRTRRLELRWPTAAKDAEAVELLQDRSVSTWTTIPYPYGAREAREYRRGQTVARRNATDLAFQIVRRADGRLAGGVGLHRISERCLSAELGYWIGAPYRRRGYASEAADRVLRLGFGELGLHRIEARVLDGNRGSQRLLRSAGFRREGRLRGSDPWPAGGYRDLLVFGRLVDDGAPGVRSDSPTRTR